MNTDIICFSHLRWNFVYQRPQHLMSRLSAWHRVFYVEEPVFDAEGETYHHVSKVSSANVYIVVPHLPPGLNEEQIIEKQKNALESLLIYRRVSNYITWYYSPMAVAFTNHLKPFYTIYDCMDELSAFLFAPPELKQREQDLLRSADLVFTGGRSLYEAKKGFHRNIHLFQSSIDKDHFHKARHYSIDPLDQRPIMTPRIGFYGVLDERLNVEMLRNLAKLRPGWQFILVGPIVKIDPMSLPSAPNIHYLGPKQYHELPQYLAGWHIAMMPFALNESTKFISPTKTPEYLAGGKPVISPSIADVVTPYGDLGLVRIADTPEQFINAAEDLLHNGISSGWLTKVDTFLSTQSWDKTVYEMKVLIEKGMTEKKGFSLQKTKGYV